MSKRKYTRVGKYDKTGIVGANHPITTPEAVWEEPEPDRFCISCGTLLGSEDGRDFCKECLSGSDR
jgi:hypothetical protein